MHHKVKGQRTDLEKSDVKHMTDGRLLIILKTKI